MVRGRFSITIATIVLIALLSSNAFAFRLLQEDETLPVRLAAGQPSRSFAVAGTPDNATTQPRQPPSEVTIFSCDFPKLMVYDTVHVLTAPVWWDKKDWLTFSVATMGVAALTLVDRPIKDEMRHHHTLSRNDATDVLRNFGGPYSFAVMGLFYAGGAAFHDQKAKAVAIDSVGSTILTSAIVVPTLKFVVGRSRPRYNDGTYHFSPFSSSDKSFPSGETAQAFAVASVIANHYDQLWIKTASYSIASLVGLSRVYQDAHFASDVVAGALIGTAIGTAIVHFNQKKRANPEKKTQFAVTPMVTANTGGIGISVVR